MDGLKGGEKKGVAGSAVGAGEGDDPADAVVGTIGEGGWMSVMIGKAGWVGPCFSGKAKEMD